MTTPNGVERMAEYIQNDVKGDFFNLRLVTA
jgi:hypothetical protein